ncbi:MAG: hypothetical protein ACRD13_07025 [Terriglobales bacterium]
MPAVAAGGGRPEFGWSPMTGLAITVAGLALLAIGRRAAKS